MVTMVDFQHLLHLLSVYEMNFDKSRRNDEDYDDEDFRQLTVDDDIVTAITKVSEFINHDLDFSSFASFVDRLNGDGALPDMLSSSTVPTEEDALICLVKEKTQYYPEDLLL